MLVFRGVSFRYLAQKLIAQMHRNLGSFRFATEADGGMEVARRTRSTLTRFAPPGWLNLRKSQLENGPQKFLSGKMARFFAPIPNIQCIYSIFTYIYHKKSSIHVGRCTSPMDPYGFGLCEKYILWGVELQSWSLEKKESYNNNNDNNKNNDYGSELGMVSQEKQGGSFFVLVSFRVLVIRKTTGANWNVFWVFWVLWFHCKISVHHFKQKNS